MKPSAFSFQLSALLLALVLSASAQQPKTVTKSGSVATANEISEDLKFPAARTLTLNGTLNGTPVGGALDLSSVDLSGDLTFSGAQSAASYSAADLFASSRLFVPKAADGSPSERMLWLSTTTADRLKWRGASTTYTAAAQSDKLSVFAATTSAELADVISNETGTGVLVLDNSPALTGTPTAPTAAAATNTTQLATTAHVFAERTNTATLTNKDLSSATNTYRSATTSSTGAVELATEAEAIAGTSSTLVATPQGVRDAVTRLQSGANFVFEGDSLTAGGWPTTVGAMSYFSGRGTVYNVSTSGHTLSSIVADYASEVAPLLNSNSVLFVWIGSNDINSTVASTWLSTFRSYLTTAKATGARVVVCTVMRRADVSLQRESVRLAINRGIIRSTDLIDVVIDCATAFDPSDTASPYYQDGVHMNATGYARLSQMVNAALEAGGITVAADDLTARASPKIVVVDGTYLNQMQVLETGTNGSHTFYKWTGSGNDWFAQRFYYDTSATLHWQYAGAAAIGAHSFTDAIALTYNGVLTLKAASAASIQTTSPTTGLGYSTGAGGAQTQATSRTTTVTLNKVTGAITLFTAAGSTTATSFTVSNSTVAATDTIVLSVKSSTNKYLAFVTAVAAGSFEITFYTTGGTSSDAPVINFAVIKAVSS